MSAKNKAAANATTATGNVRSLRDNLGIVAGNHHVTMNRRDRRRARIAPDASKRPVARTYEEARSSYPEPLLASLPSKRRVGAKPNDIILSLDGQKFSAVPQVQTYVKSHAGQTVDFLVKRGSQQTDLKIIIFLAFKHDRLRHCILSATVYKLDW